MRGFLFVCILFIAGCSSKNIQVVDLSINKKGRLAPDFVLPDLAGNKVRLSDYRGSIVLVHFWATWCSTCIKEMLELQALHEKTALNSRFHIVAISVDSNYSAARKFAEKHNLHYLILKDVSKTAQRKFGAFELPRSYLIDKTGRLILFPEKNSGKFTEKLTGAKRWTSEEYLHALRYLSS